MLQEGSSPIVREMSVIYFIKSRKKQNCRKGDTKSLFPIISKDRFFQMLSELD